MLISVDLPAPFSPTIPWIVPLAILSETLRLARTAPKLLSIPIISTAGATGAPADLEAGEGVVSVTEGDKINHGPGTQSRAAMHLRSARRAGVVGHVVVDLDL